MRSGAFAQIEIRKLEIKSEDKHREFASGKFRGKILINNSLFLILPAPFFIVLQKFDVWREEKVEKQCVKDGKREELKLTRRERKDRMSTSHFKAFNRKRGIVPRFFWFPCEAIFNYLTPYSEA